MNAGEMVSTAVPAMLSGWVAGRVIDSGLRVPGVGPLTGLVGLWVGQWLWFCGGWDTGPRIAACPIVPAIVGALAVSAVLKLVAVGFAGSRR